MVQIRLDIATSKKQDLYAIDFFYMIRGTPMSLSLMPPVRDDDEVLEICFGQPLLMVVAMVVATMWLAIIGSFAISSRWMVSYIDTRSYVSFEASLSILEWTATSPSSMS